MALREQGFSAHSAKALGKILRGNEHIRSIDLSLNTLHTGLPSLVRGICDNDTLVAVKLRNNNIDGRKHQQLLFDLVHEHPSLASLDLGNSCNVVKNRNPIHDEGLAAIIEGIAQSKDYSLIQELYLSYSSITAEGLQRFARIPMSGVEMNLQILDLSYNDLGSVAPTYLRDVIPTLISLNLSHTKLGKKGAVDLAAYLKEATAKNNGFAIMRNLDLSHNNITSAGFLKLVGRMKKSSALLSLNFSYNDFSVGQEKFVTLQKFLARNQSCRTLLLSGCKIKDTGMTYVGLGLSENNALVRLGLSENEHVTKDGLTYLTKGMLDAEESRLVELDLAKSNFDSKAIQPLIRLLGLNHKIRSLNLKGNTIGDDGAQDLLGQLMSNEYITRVNLDLNPFRHAILTDIDAHCRTNVMKVNSQEVPSMTAEILDVKKKTAQTLFDCAMDPLISAKVQSFIPSDRLDRLKQVNSRTGAFHKRAERDMTRIEKARLLGGKFFRSYDVVAVTDEISSRLKSMKVERAATYEGLGDRESLKEAAMNEDRAKLQELILQKEKLMDIKRELEFELLMMEE